MSLDRIVLGVGAVGLAIVAITYGIAPFGFSNDLYGLTVENTNDAMILRGIMGLLLGTVALYARGFVDVRYRRPALLTMGYFMTGLVGGRIVSIIFDGTPAPLYFVYLVAEAAMAAGAFIALNRMEANPSQAQ